MRRLKAIIAFVASACLLRSSPVAQATSPLDVVVIGDSFAAGYGAGDYEPGSIGCFRSRSAAYGKRVADTLRKEGRLAMYTNVACAGATTTSALFQLRTLSTNTDLVLVTIGANNGAFAFGPYARTCLEADCSGQPTRQFMDGLPNVGRQVQFFLREVTRRAPAAHIVLVGYGEVLEPTTVVSEAVDPICGLFTAEEHRDVRRAQVAMDRTLTLAAYAAKVAYISPYLGRGWEVRPRFAAHSLCDIGPQWYNGAQALPQFGGDGAVLHGNASFHKELAKLITV